MKKAKQTNQASVASLQARFLRLFEKQGVILPCTEMLGIERGEVLRWRETSPEFARRMDRAKEIFNDHLADLIARSASELARKGNRQMAKVIRDLYGKEALDYVMSGNNLKLKARQS